MGDKRIIRETVPPDTKRIWEWAYANCKNMTEIFLPAGCEVCDNVFYGCDSLNRVCIYDKTASDTEPVPRNISPELLALSIHARSDEVHDLIKCSCVDKEFIRAFDEHISRYVREPDDNGFEPFLAGGEEDYEDASKEEERFVLNRQKTKVTMIYERMLLADSFPIPEDIYAACVSYLKDHNPVPAFLILTDAPLHRNDYRKIYFDLLLDKDVLSETLLELAQNDTMLRAKILASGGDGLLSFLPNI